MSGLYGAGAAASLFHVAPSAFIALHLLAWSACDFLLARRLNPEITIALPGTWFLRELLAFPLWLHTALGRTVRWRGRRLAIQRGGLLDSLN